MDSLELTAFGFTPTESLAYLRLLEDGPASGYALAKRLSIARANAYHALNGLVAKGAAELTGSEPRTYRAVQAQALVARLARESAARLDDLEARLGDIRGAGAPAIVPFAGDAEFQAILLRTAVRPVERVEFLAAASVLALSLPVWRARQAHRRPTSIWCIGPIPPEFPGDQVTSVAEQDARRLLGELTIVLLAPGAAILGCTGRGGSEGYWTSDPVFILAARAARQAVAGEGP